MRSGVYRQSGNRLIPQLPSKAAAGKSVGFAVGDTVFTKFYNKLREEDVWYSGSIMKLPGRSGKYQVEYEGPDIQYSILLEELFVKLPDNGIAYNGGNFSSIVGGRIVEMESTMESNSSDGEERSSMDFSVSIDDSVAEEEPPFTFNARVDPDIPSIYEFVSKNTHILRHVPSDCRADYGRALNALIYDIVNHNDILAWSSYFMFTSVVLHPSPRAGRKHRKEAKKYTKNRLKEWKGEEGSSFRDKVLARVKIVSTG